LTGIECFKRERLGDPVRGVLTIDISFCAGN